MPLPSPKSEDPRQRFEELKAAATAALEEIIASANEAGWGTQEVAVALIEAAKSLRDANTVDPDPSVYPPITDSLLELIGRVEQFD